MRTVETNVTIDAAPQTVWSVMEDLDKYPDWDKLIHEQKGILTIGEVIEGKVAQLNGPDILLSSTLTRIVGARELRWRTIVQGDHKFLAEKCFLLTPNSNGGTAFVHNEGFDGPDLTSIWSCIEAKGRIAYKNMNADLKSRAEALAKAEVALHPAVKNGEPAKPSGRTATLTCKCSSEKVEVVLEGLLYHNRLCGCTQCWKPTGALFAQTAFAASDSVRVSAHELKLVCVDPDAAFKRYACKGCGVHMLGRVENHRHQFYGLVLLHPELSNISGPTIEFAGFVSSIIEAGTSPSLMQAVRRQLSRVGIPAYDTFSPELMDIIAWHKVKLTCEMSGPNFVV